MSGKMLDRRELIAGAGAIAATACMPLALALPEPAVGAAAAASAMPADWHIDDMWGVYPRPHEAIGYGRPRDDELAVAVHPADVHFLV